MDALPEPLAAAIGGRVRHERQARRWTLDQLARAAGVSRRLLVSLEQGSANPSVGTLLKISGALGVGLPALVDAPQQRPVKVTRRGSGATLWRGAGGGCGVLVAGAQDPDAVELWDWTLAPGDRHASDGHTAGTRELLHVRRGTVTVTVGAETVELCLGDAMAFHGDVPHCYANPTGRPARFSLAVVEPAFGGGSRVRAGHG